MDKRSIFFVICLSVTLFFVNIYFNQQDMERRKQWAEYQQKLASHQEKELRADVSARTASLNELPLAEYHVGDELRFGILVESNLLTLALTNDEPAEIEVLDNGRSEAFTLVTSFPVEGAPLIYQRKDAAPLTAGMLSARQVTDVQIISMVRIENEVHLTQGLGVYKQGKLTLPAGGPAHNGFALVETPDSYLPVGMYLASERELVALEQVPSLDGLIATQQVAVEEALSGNQAEEFFVLENTFQQLVFSSKGGALVEINLPFLSDTNPDSVVRYIEADTHLAQDHPANARFPLHAYQSAPVDGSKTPVKHAQGKKGGYYPLLRRSLMQNNEGIFRLDPKYYALNVVSEYPEVAELSYKLKEFTDTKIVLEANQAHRRITKTFQIEAGNTGAPYVLTCDVQVDGDSRGLWLTSGIPEVEWISGAPAPALKYRLTRQDSSDVEKLDLPKDTIRTSSLSPDWFCNSNGFFGLILDPLTEIGTGYRADKVPGTVAPSRLIKVDEEFERYKAKDLPGYIGMLPLPSTGGKMEFRVYAGPFADATLRNVDEILAEKNEGASPDYRSSQSYHGYFAFISRPFAKFLFIVMNTFYGLTSSWALSIVLLTVAVRLMLYPLNSWSMKKMRTAQKLKPLLDAIDLKYKKDPQKAQVEKFSLLREHKANPAAGCFGLLIQMPFLIGMFDLLKTTFELRGAPFIPGWIDNLTAPDVLFTWGFSLPVIGNQLHLLPFLTGGMMYLQSKLTTSLPKDKSEWTDAHRQQAMMGPMMSGMFTLFFYNFPSGLNIYWLSSTALGILQQLILNKQVDNAPMPVPPPTKDDKGRKKLRRPA